MVNAGRVGLIPKGEFDPSVKYEKLDIVSYQNKGYIAKEKEIPIGTLPTDEDYWLLSFDIAGFASVNNPRFIGLVSMGSTAIAEGSESLAQGYEVQTIGGYSHAEGRKTVAYGDFSHAEGYETIADGMYSHTEGFKTSALGEFSHAEGYETHADANYAHAEGRFTYAMEIGSHAEGLGTIARSRHQLVIGKYNIEDDMDKYAFIIGNGTDDDHRSNALAIKWDGTIVTSNF